MKKIITFTYFSLILLIILYCIFSPNSVKTVKADACPPGGVILTYKNVDNSDIILLKPSTQQDNTGSYPSIVYNANNRPMAYAWPDNGDPTDGGGSGNSYAWPHINHNPLDPPTAYAADLSPYIALAGSYTCTAYSYYWIGSWFANNNATLHVHQDQYGDWTCWNWNPYSGENTTSCWADDEDGAWNDPNPRNFDPRQPWEYDIYYEAGNDGENALVQSYVDFYSMVVTNPININSCEITISNCNLTGTIQVPWYTQVEGSNASNNYLPDYYLLLDTDPTQGIATEANQSVNTSTEIHLPSSDVIGSSYVAQTANYPPQFTININSQLDTSHLIDGKPYYWRLAQVGTGTTAYYPGQNTFTITVPPPSNVIMNTPDFNATSITPHGSFSSASTTSNKVWFRYSTTNPGTTLCDNLDKDTFGSKIDATNSILGPTGDTAPYNFTVSPTISGTGLATYYLCMFASNSGGQTASPVKQITTQTPPTVNLTTSANTINSGDSVTLNYTVTGAATGCTPGFGDTPPSVITTSGNWSGNFPGSSGSQVIKLTNPVATDQTITFTLVCTNLGANAAASPQAVTVHPSITPRSGSISRVFVTSKTFTGALGGLPGADLQCQLAATSLATPGVFIAWLSDSTTSAKDRINPTGVNNQYVLLNNTPLGSWNNFIDNSNLQHTVDITELGTSQNNDLVWTDTNPDGSITSSDPSSNCSNWTAADTSSTGNLGSNTAVNINWTKDFPNNCNFPSNLYCVEKLASATGAAPPPGVCQNNDQATGLITAVGTISNDFGNTIQFGNQSTGVTATCITGSQTKVDPLFKKIDVSNYPGLFQLYFTNVTPPPSASFQKIDLSSPSPPCPGPDYCENDIPLTNTFNQDLLYHIPGNLIINGSLPGISGSFPNQSLKQTGVIFIDGNLIIKQNITYSTPTKGLVFIVSGNILINPSVTEVDAVLISSGTICTATDISPPADLCSDSNSSIQASQLLIQGSLISLDQSHPIYFRRNLTTNDPAHPAELIQAQPKYFAILKDILSLPSQSWSELGSPSGFGTSP